MDFEDYRGSRVSPGAAAPSAQPQAHTRAGQRLASRVAARMAQFRAERAHATRPHERHDVVELNKVLLTGWLASEPLLYDIGDHPLARLALACERRWRTPDGTLQVETIWVNLSAWEDLADRCGRLLHRGDRIYAEGRLHLWSEQRGAMSYACHTVVLDRIVLLVAGRSTEQHAARLP